MRLIDKVVVVIYTHFISFHFNTSLALTYNCLQVSNLWMSTGRLYQFKEHDYWHKKRIRGGSDLKQRLGICDTNLILLRHGNDTDLRHNSTGFFACNINKARFSICVSRITDALKDHSGLDISVIICSKVTRKNIFFVKRIFSFT